MKVNMKMGKRLGNGILNLRVIKYLKKCKIIFLIAILSGYGSYNQEGLKNGVWLELSETYW